MDSLLSCFRSEKSGAVSPTLRVPARAWVHRVSNGKSRKGIGPGILAMTPANVSGGCRITSNNAAQPSTHNTANTPNTRVSALLTDFHFMFNGLSKFLANTQVTRDYNA